MPRPLLSVVKMAAALVALSISLFMKLPAILLVYFCWCGWLWYKVREWKGRLLVTLSIALLPLGWSLCFPLWSYFARKGEVSYFGGEKAYWAEMATAGFWLGIVLMIVGIGQITYVDYREALRQTMAGELTKETELDEGPAWPPAPKQPQ